MNSKSRYELAASVCRGKVWLDNTALAAISRMYRKRIENATSKLEATVEQGRYASFRIDQALDHPKAPRFCFTTNDCFIGRGHRSIIYF